MPAWSGGPDDVAALTAATADDVEAFGIDRVLAAITALAGDDWVLDELRRGWRTYDDVLLAAALRAAASSAGPTPTALAAITPRRSRGRGPRSCRARSSRWWVGTRRRTTAGCSGAPADACSTRPGTREG